MTTVTEEIRDILLAERDERYRDFNSRLIPNVPKDAVIGVRMPALRRIARDTVKRGMAEEFMKELPHTYHEENLLHALLIGSFPDEDECIKNLEGFLPYVDNWAVCDSLRPKVFKSCTPRQEAWLTEKLDAAHTYTVRFAIEMLMLHYLGDTFKPRQMEKVSRTAGDDYYLNMMVAWYFATALAERYEHTIAYLEEKRLSPWIHNKTISKSCDSLRLTDAQKEYIKTLKIR